jgi:tetratricopeptide (TPR) repeat protein
MTSTTGASAGASSSKSADEDSNGGGASPRDLYEAGNSEAALNLLVENATRRRQQASKIKDSGHMKKFNQSTGHSSDEEPLRRPSAPFNTLQEEYNSHILTALMANPPTNNVDMFLDNLEPIEQAIFKSYETSTTLKTECEEVIMVYNKALAFLAAGDVRDAVALAWKQFNPFLDATRSAIKVPDDLLRLACRLGFVLIDALLALWPQRYHIPEQVYGTDDPPLSIDLILTWLNDVVIEKELGDRDPQLKFLLGLYKSRIDFYERDRFNKIPEAHIRSARKELKQAMEIFQHKLRAVSNDSGSLASSSYSEELNAGTSGANSRSGADDKSPTPLSTSNNNNNMPRVLQQQNQAILNLKANTEQLKGNMKKSLILCAEANNMEEDIIDNTDDSSTYYEAIHQNNLGIVYETSGKPYLALHAFSKALRLSTKTSHDRPDGSGNKVVGAPAALFEPDGTARPDMTLTILHNTGISSLKAGNYLGAYKCFAILLREGCIVWSVRPRTWLRIAEACIGLANQQKKEDKASNCAKLHVEGETRGVLVGRENVREVSASELESETSVEIFGTAEDMEEVQRKPLARARLALEIALMRMRVEEGPEIDLAVVSTRVSLSYVYLELRDYTASLSHAHKVLSIIKHFQNDPDMDIARATMLKRQEATARMYACEASAMIGQAVESMKFIAGDGEKNAIDRLASDLAGVTLETAATDPKAKARLAKAQAMVRCSASAASACLGNLGASKQLALSAQAMENSYSISREKSSARKALLYSMLREGNHGAALSLLRSAR